MPRLPALLAGSRRWMFARLVLTGVGQAGVAVLTAVMIPVLLTATSTGKFVTSLVVLLAGALALGLMRALERLFGEQLGQDYVQQLRVGLVASSLADGGPSVGITVARTTNDLSSVRNWIALGIAPLAVGVPIIIGTTAALALLEPVLSLAVLAPMLVLAAVLGVQARQAFVRSRELRRRRGKLAAHVADTVTAADSIRSAGGSHRELKHVDELGGRVADAAVSRARVAGSIRGSAAVAATISMVLVAAIGSWYAFSGSTIATALIVVGVLVGPVSDLGRIVEYRQSYKAAARILGPALTVGAQAGEDERLRASRHRNQTPPESESDRSIQIDGLRVNDAAMPDLVATPGARVVLRSADADRVARLIRAVAGLAPDTSGRIVVAGSSLPDLPATQRRLFVGHAARAAPLERGTVARAVRYRDPASKQPIGDVLAAVGLTDTVERLRDGERTVLRNGGEPLSSPERARLLLARALYGEPPLLVLDHIDAQLGAAGQDMLRTCLEKYEGVALVATDDADAFLTDYQCWDLDDQPATSHRHDDPALRRS